LVAVEEVIDALDKKLLQAIEKDWAADFILALAEARAWLVNPGQSHGGGSPTTES
jgi:hypothetical protein